MAPTQSDIVQLNEALARQHRAVVLLGGPCEKNVPCAHCGEGSDETLSLENILRQIDGVDPGVVDLGLLCKGSFWKSSLDGIREPVLQRVNGMCRIKRVRVESRPTMINEDRIAEFEIALPHKERIVGGGFDHFRDLYRNRYLGRGDTLAEYQAAMQVPRSQGTKMLTFVALGCPYLSEKGAIESAIETAPFAAESGADIVSLEPLQIQSGTIQEQLWQEGKWQLPWNWSSVVVARAVVEELHMRGVQIWIGGEVVAPIPYGKGNNRCPLCDSDGRFTDAFHRFNVTQVIECLDVVCGCHEAYLQALMAGPLSVRAELHGSKRRKSV